MIQWLLLPVLTNLFILYYLYASNSVDINLRKQNEKCVACHVKTINQSMSNQFQHEPFFNRECDKCHIPEDSGESQTGWIGIQGEPRMEKPQAGPAEKPHPQLREPEAASIDACYSCHTPEKLGTTHSIRVYSGPDAKIPDDLPTVKGGMMTCATCHHPHGGAVKYFVRKKITTKLCVSCHYTFMGKSRHTVFEN